MNSGVRHKVSEKLIAKVRSHAEEAALLIDNTGIITAANDRAIRFLGYDDAARVDGRMILEFSHPSDKKAFQEFIDRAKNFVVPQLSSEFLIRYGDVDYTLSRLMISCDDSAECEFRVIVLHDVLASYLFVNELRRQMLFLDDLDIPILHFSDEGILLDGNKTAHDMLGSVDGSMCLDSLFGSKTLVSLHEYGSKCAQTTALQNGSRSYVFSIEKRRGGGFLAYGIRPELVHSLMQDMPAGGKIAPSEQSRSRQRDVKELGTILLLSESGILRNHVREILSREKIEHEMMDVSEAFHGDALEEAKPSVVVYCSAVIGENEMEDIRTFSERIAPSRLLAICIRSHAEQDLDIIRAGAHGLVGSEENFSQIMPALFALHDGELWCTRSIMQKVLEQSRLRLKRLKKESGDNFDLTTREIEVLQCVIQNKTNRQIAHELGVAYTTIVTHVYNIYRKLNVHNRMQAINFAINNGLVERI